MIKIINSLSNENKFSFYSSLFRIFICFHLIKKIFLSWNYKELLYSSNSFYIHENTMNLMSFLGVNRLISLNFEFFYFIYFILIILYFFGIGKNITAFFLYLFFELLQNLCPTILNGGDNLLKFIMIYMIFIDSYDYFSVNKIKNINNQTPKIKYFISNLAGYSICFHLCLVYFISAIHKIHSDVWFNGVATYYILSLERFRGTSYNLDLVKNGLFITLTTYGTILLELFYPMLIWFTKTKRIMIVLAISLHLSIYVFMMIYDFQIVFILVQGFFIKNKSWIYEYDLITSNKYKFTIYIDGWCKICQNFKSFINKVDVFKVIEIKNIREFNDFDDLKIKYMYSTTSNGKEFYGFNSLYEINKRLIILWIFIPLMYLFKVTKLGNYLYNELSVKRKIIPLHCDSNCEIKTLKKFD